MKENKLYTIGHSKHSTEYFIQLLNKYSINCIIDVRSIPYSKIAPQFNKESILKDLKDNNILYSHMPEEFGARKNNQNLLDLEGKVDFQKIRDTEKFKIGIEKIKNGVFKDFNVALMCSEANPFDCHRFVMIAYQLVNENINVKHILKDGNIIENAELEKQLLIKYSKILPVNNLFVNNVTEKLRLDCAYRLRNKDIAFTSIETDNILQ